MAEKSMAPKPRVLIVEDEADLRDFLKEALQSEEIAVEEAVNGEEGLQKAGSKDYHMILSDIKMPVMDGITMLEKIRAAGVITPVVILSAFSESELVIEALRLGAFDYLQKPVELQKLVATVKKASELGAEILRWKDDDAQGELKNLSSQGSESSLRRLERMVSVLGHENRLLRKKNNGAS